MDAYRQPRVGIRVELNDTFVLTGGSVLKPVGELPVDVQRAMDAEEGDFVVSRANSRAHMKIVNRETAELLDFFRSPTTIARAVARFSIERGRDPERVIEDALLVLPRLISSGFLARAGSDESLPIDATLGRDSSILDWSIVRRLQFSEDAELYQVHNAPRSYGMLKISRIAIKRGVDCIEREAGIFAHLSGEVAPRLLRSGKWNDRTFLITDWFPGASAETIFAELRDRRDIEVRSDLREVGTRILRAYERLHALDVIHGDVHPRNVLVDGRLAVVLVDFGFARLAAKASARASHPRGGVAFFYEPEFALAQLSGKASAPTFLGDQYALAAMLYRLVTGSHYLNFSLEREKAIAQIVNDPMLPFTERGVEAWPELERVLQRALNKRPADRFAAISEFVDAWSSVELPHPSRSAKRARSSRSDWRAIRERFFRSVAIGGSLLTRECSDASLYYGDAGVACALMNIAGSTDSAEALALADVWSERAVRGNGALDAASLYHGRAGTYFIQAVIAGARGDSITLCSAARAYVESCKERYGPLDLTMGFPGALLGSAMLLDLIEANGDADRDSVRDILNSLGNDLLSEVWKSIDLFAPVGESAELTNLGVAHGWAGLLYATLCWCACARVPLPPRLGLRLHELAACSVPVDRGLRYPCENVAAGLTNGYMPGWCNGSAGYVFLWDEAYRATGEAGYLDLAEGAAWNAWESRGQNPSLCCGAAGQAYALLRLYRRSRDKIWLKRAHDLAELAVLAANDERDRGGTEGAPWRPESLYRGGAGVAALVADLENPEYARMPIFEREAASF